jgi:hypothetical protein
LPIITTASPAGIGLVDPFEERDALQVRGAELLPVARPALLDPDQLGHADALAAHGLEAVGPRQRLARSTRCGHHGALQPVSQ